MLERSGDPQGRRSFSLRAARQRCRAGFGVAPDSAGRRGVADNGTVPSAANPRATAAAPTPTGGARGPAAFSVGVSRPWLFAGLAALFLGLVAALLFSGAAAAREVSDPGALVRWGLPASKAVHNIALATVIGGLLFAVAILPRSLAGSRSKAKDAPEHPAFTRTLAVAGIAGVVWTLSAIAVLVLSYSDIAGQGISGDPEFTRSLVYFMTDIETGRAWLAVVVIAAVVTTALFGVRVPGRPGSDLGARPHRACTHRADRPLRQLGRPRRRHQLAWPPLGRCVGLGRRHHHAGTAFRRPGSRCVRLAVRRTPGYHRADAPAVLRAGGLRLHPCLRLRRDQFQHPPDVLERPPRLGLRAADPGQGSGDLRPRRHRPDAPALGHPAAGQPERRPVRAPRPLAARRRRNAGDGSDVGCRRRARPLRAASG